MITGTRFVISNKHTLLIAIFLLVELCFMIVTKGSHKHLFYIKHRHSCQITQSVFFDVHMDA